MNLAQIAMTVMLSMVCAIPCSQAEFTLPPFENNLKLQGTGATGLSLGRAGRRLGGPRAFWRCSARATLLSRAVRCRALLRTSHATACEPLHRFVRFLALWMRRC